MDSTVANSTVFREGRCPLRRHYLGRVGPSHRRGKGIVKRIALAPADGVMRASASRSIYRIRRYTRAAGVVLFVKATIRVRAISRPPRQ